MAEPSDVVSQFVRKEPAIGWAKAAKKPVIPPPKISKAQTYSIKVGLSESDSRQNAPIQQSEIVKMAVATPQHNTYTCYLPVVVSTKLKRCI